MKANNRIKVVLSIIFTSILLSVMAMVPSETASANPFPKSNSVNTECKTNMLEGLEKFIEDRGRTPDAYTSVGIVYLSCGNLALAEDKFIEAIQLTKGDSNSFAEPIARYGLWEIDFLQGKIDAVQRNDLIKEIYAKFPVKKRRGLNLTGRSTSLKP